MQATIGLPYYTPYEWIFNEDGTFTYGDMEVYPFNNQQIDLIKYYKKNNNRSRRLGLNGQTYFEITPLKGLTIRAAQAVDGNDGLGERVALPSYTQSLNTGMVSESFSRYYQLTSTNTIEYKTSFASSHYLTVLLGHESIVKHSKDFGAVGSGLTDDRLHEFGSATDITSWSGGDMSCAINSFFANFSYDYGGRYFIDASVRTDGSSVFGKNHKYATFYSVGAMWKVKQESFLRPVKWIDDLNVNLSYGTTGNSELSSWYAHLGLVGSGPKYDGEGGFGIAQTPNEEFSTAVPTSRKFPKTFSAGTQN